MDAAGHIESLYDVVYEEAAHDWRASVDMHEPRHPLQPTRAEAEAERDRQVTPAG